VHCFRETSDRLNLAHILSLTFPECVFVPVRYYDASQTKLLLLRVPRDVVTSVRASLSFLTTVRTRRVALHTVSIHGSARTAKLATVRRIRSYYREQVLQMRRQLPQRAAELARIGQLCSSMEEQVNMLQNIDF
jgi:Rpp14/Pop5 family